MPDKDALVVPEDVDADQLVAYIKGEGPVPDRAEALTTEEFLARDRVEKCTCGMISCVCELVKPHNEDCRFRNSVLCPVAIECEHGYDVCPKCDPCTCGDKPHD